MKLELETVAKEGASKDYIHSRMPSRVWSATEPTTKKQVNDPRVLAQEWKIMGAP